jgi:predicted short-subunit dehydrogenase-like oxidoreductase (DUF2520 family)
LALFWPFISEYPEPENHQEMHNSHNISFVMIGTGNLAHHLSYALINHGFTIKQVFGKNAAKVKKFAHGFNIPFCSDKSKIDLSADVYLFCVPDDQISILSGQLNFKDKVAIHCSGSTEMSVLKKCAENYGVLYPLYTFSDADNEMDFKKVPFYIEANSKISIEILKKIIRTFGAKAKLLSSASRVKMHLAAVLTANFANHLMSLADEYLKKENVGNVKDLIPLIEKTVSKLKHNNPKEAQTGPARRHDKNTISKHLKMLEKYQVQKKLYKLISESISANY